MKKFKYFLLPIIVVIIFISIFNNIVNKKYKEIMSTKNLTSIKHTYNHMIRDRGKALKNEIERDGDLMLLGSSELAVDVPQNPINNFPNNELKKDITILGRAYTQSIQHANILANIDNLDKDDKVAIIISAQWFESESGIYGSNFAVNFSEQQFYDFIKNEKIDKESKMYYTERISELLRASGEYGEERIYANLYHRDTIISKTLLTILKPYYSFKEYMLDMKDKVQTIKSLEKLENKKEIQVKDIKWKEEFEKAEKEGESKVTNNDIYVEDTYYNTNLKGRYDSLKDGWKNVDLNKSKEMQDYEFLLNTCENLGIKPLIILMPVNGLYYDHIGLGLEKRTKFYNKIEEMAEEKDFDVINLQNKEYEKYYMYDVMHLGWKGWLTINEEISKYYQGK